MFIQTLLDTRTLSVFEDVKCVNMIWALKIIAEDIGTGLDQRQLLEYVTNTFPVIPYPCTRPLFTAYKSSSHTHTPASSHWPLTLAPSALSSQVLINVTAMFHLTI